MNRKALGKGIGVLIPTENPENTQDKSGVIEVDINKIEPNKMQPRKYFDEDSLNELAESLKTFGIIQPLIVKEEEGYYSIIAGERRWRAARIAKLKTLPVIIKEYNAVEMLQVALIENIQRKDLNPVEEALCYKRLIDEYFYSQEDVAEKVGKSRSTVSNAISLLNLDERVQNFIIEGKLSVAKGRALLALSNIDFQLELAEKIIDEDLSLKDIEKQIQLINQNSQAKKNNLPQKNTNYLQAEQDLKHILGTKVLIKDGKNKGKIEIEYYSNDELDRLMSIFKSIKY